MQKQIERQQPCSADRLFDESVDSHNQGIVAGFTGYVCSEQLLAESLTTLTGGACEDETVTNTLAC